MGRDDDDGDRRARAQPELELLELLPRTPLARIDMELRDKPSACRSAQMICPLPSCCMYISGRGLIVYMYHVRIYQYTYILFFADNKEYEATISI